MMSITSLVISTFLVLVIGGGGFYLLWRLTRPKKKIWKAKIFTVSEGVRQEVRDKKGNIVSQGGLRDLIYYGEDIIEKVVRGPGMVIYRLKRLGKSVPAITNNVVIGSGKDSYVHVLYKDGVCTLMKPGYSTMGDVIFDPVPYDSLSLVSNEIELQRQRRAPTKDILERVLPWIGIGLFIFGMIAVAYFYGNAVIKSSENYVKAATTYKESVAELVNGTKRVVDSKNDKLGIQKTNPPPIN